MKLQWRNKIMNSQETLVKVCVDLVTNPTQIQHFSEGKDANTKIREAFFEIMGTDKPNMKDVRRHKVAIFEILEEVLTETYLNGVNQDEFFMQFADIKNIAKGDRNEYYVKDTAVLVASEHSGNNWAIHRQKLEGGVSFSVKTKAHSIAVYGDFFLFLTGRLSFGELIAETAKGFQNKIYEGVALSFGNAAASLPTNLKATGTYDEKELISLYSHVEAASGSRPYVVGTRAALAEVTAGGQVEYFSEAMKNELHNTGRIGVYKGMTLITLPTVHKANSFDFAYDDKQLLILPSNNTRPVKVVFEGDSLMKETSDSTANVDMSFDYSFIAEFGINVVFDSVFGAYTLA